MVGRNAMRFAPHVDLAGHPLDQVDRREAAVGLGVVRGREVDPERPHVRVAERVAAQDLALDLELVEAPASSRDHGSTRRFYQAAAGRGLATLSTMAEYGTMRVKSGLAEMLKGGVIMDVVDAEQAKIAEEAGAFAVMALERVPADIRRDGGVARMSDPEMISEIQEAVTIPVMAKCRIGHFAEAQILQALEIDYIDESEVLTPADLEHHVDKWKFTVPFVCGCDEPRRGAAAHRGGRGDDPHEGRGGHRRHRQRGHAHALGLRPHPPARRRSPRRSCTPRRRSCRRRTSSCAGSPRTGSCRS